MPLRHGAWAEVRTLGSGAPPWSGPDAPIHTTALAYLSRRTDAETFGQRAWSELYRRGVLTAAAVAAVLDGAAWEQGFIDLECPHAVRIVDVPPAAQRVSEIGQALWGEGSADAQQWSATPLHILQHLGARPGLPALRCFQQGHPDNEVLTAHRAYLQTRAAPMEDPHFQAEGWPSGSGMVDRGNNLVVAARRKGAGMHWAREQVNPMLALRNIVCRNRWQACWPAVRAALRPSAGQRRWARRQRARAAARQEHHAPGAAIRATAPATTLPGTCRPAANHPWRRPFSPRALHRARIDSPAAKL